MYNISKRGFKNAEYDWLGRINKNIGDYGYNLEIKSLNSKSLNLNVIISPIFSPLEINIQNFIKSTFNAVELTYT